MLEIYTKQDWWPGVARCLKIIFLYFELSIGIMGKIETVINVEKAITSMSNQNKPPPSSTQLEFYQLWNPGRGPC